MSLKRFMKTETVVVAPTATVAEAAILMKAKNVGSVIVVHEKKPLGILTDRDIVLRVVTENLDASNTEVAQVMTTELMTLPENLGLHQALETIKRAGVRRFPVVDADGNLMGIFTLDDVLYLLGKEMADVTSAMRDERLPRFFWEFLSITASSAL